MGPGGRREACKLTASRETRLGGDAASQDVQLRAATPGWRLGLHGVAGCRGEEARHAPEKGWPSLAADIHESGSRGASWSVAGVLGWFRGGGRRGGGV